MSSVQQILAALAQSGGGGGTSYNATVAGISPPVLMWMRADETTGSTANDSSGNGYHATAVSPFSNVGNTVAAPSGFAGLGNGHFTNRVTTITGAAALAVGNLSSSSWTMWAWVTGAPNGAQYILSRLNDAAMIYDFVNEQVEFFSSGFTGTNPRTGSSISLPAADTTTPHLIVYRYDNGTWSGWKDGVNVFSVARSFGLPTTTQKWCHGANESGNTFLGTLFDCGVTNSAISDADIAAMYAARDII